MRVLNRTKEFYKGKTKSSFEVESSDSPMYKIRMSDYWNTRIYAEYQDCISNGGRVIFANLTYDDSHLPRYKYFSEKDNVWKSFPTFSKKDKDRFLNSLLKRWERAGFTGDNCSYSFKYIWANEYGTTEGRTHRPHYHCMFFIPAEIYEYELGQAFNGSWSVSIEMHWKWLISHYWSKKRYKVKKVPFKRKEGFKEVKLGYLDSLGMVRWSPDNPIFVNSEFASMYCSKYMFKSDNLLINDEVREYYDEFGQLPDDGKKKGSLTTHWQSLHFGESLKKKYDDPDVYAFGLNLNLPSEVKSGKIVRHPIPPYIDNKVSKKYDRESGIYRLTDRGRFLKFSKFVKTYVKNIDKFKSLVSDEVIDSVVPGIITDPRNPLYSFGTKEALKDYLHNVDSRKFYEFAYLYRKVWDGLLVESQLLNDLKSCSFEDFKEISLNQYYKNLAPHLDGVPCCTCETGIFRAGFVTKSFISEDVLGIPCASYVDVYPVEECDIFYEVREFLEIYDKIREYKLRCSEKLYNEICDRHRKFKNLLLIKSA